MSEKLEKFIRKVKYNEYWKLHRRKNQRVTVSIEKVPSFDVSIIEREHRQIPYVEGTEIVKMWTSETNRLFFTVEAK